MNHVQYPNLAKQYYIPHFPSQPPPPLCGEQPATAAWRQPALSRGAWCAPHWELSSGQR